MDKRINRAAGQAAVVLSAMLALPAGAAIRTWNPPDAGGGGSISWNLPLNWGGAAPANDISSDIALFNSTTYNFQPSLDQQTPQSINGLTFGDGSTAAGALTIGTVAFTKGTSGVTSAAATTITMAAGAMPVVGQEVTGSSSIPAGTIVTNVAGQIITLSQATTGTINNNVTLTFKPTLTIGNAGILVNAGVAGIQTVAAPVRIGANQNWTNNATLASALTVSGSINTDGNTISLNGATGSSTAITGVIVGTGGVNFNGSGAVVISAANTYTGASSLTSGTLTLGVGAVVTGGVLVSNPTGRGTFTLGTSANSVTLASNASSGTPRTLSSNIIVDGDVVIALGAANTSGRVSLNVMNGLTTPNTITLNRSATFTVNTGMILDLVGQVNGGGFGITKVGPGVMNIGSTGTPESVANSINGLTLSAGNTTLNKTAGVDAVGGTITINSGGTLTMGANNENIANTSTVTVNTGGTWSLNGRTETIAGLTVTGTVSTGTGTVIIGGAGTVNLGAGTISTALQLGSGGLIVNAAGTATVSGAISGTGNIDLQAGTLNVNTTQLGTGSFTIGTGTTINTQSAGTTNTSVTPINLNGNFTFTGSGALNLGSGAVALAAPITLTGSASTLTFGGVLSGGNGIFDITKVGNGTVAFSQGVTISTPQTVNATTGTFRLDGAISGLNGVFSLIKAGAGTFEYSPGIALTSNQSLVVGAGQTTLSGVISGTGFGLTTSGATARLTNTNTYTGATNVLSGTLQIGTAAGSVAGSNVFVTGQGTVLFDTAAAAGTVRANSVTLAGGTLRANGTSTANTIDRINGAIVINGDTAMNGINFITVAPATGGTGKNAQLSATGLTRANGGVAMVTGTALGAAPGVGIGNVFLDSAPALSGAGGAAGTTTMSIIPWLVGSTTVGSNTDFITYDANGLRPLAAGEYANAIVDGVASTNNVKLAVSGTTPINVTLTSATAVNSLYMVAGASSGAVNITGGTLSITSGAMVLSNPNGGITVSSAIDFGAAQGVIGFSRGKPTTLNGSIAGTNGVVFYQWAGPPVQGSGGTGLTLGANTYSGDTYVFGRIEAQAANALPNGSRLGDIYDYGIINVTSLTVINGLNGDGSVSRSGSGSGAFTLGDNNANGNFTGVISQAAGTLNLVKIGAGTQTLAGINTYTGTTSVAAGTLEVSGSLGTGNVSVANGATLQLDANTVIADTATLSLLNGATANLNFAGTEAVNNLILNGVTMTAGVYGSTSSGATFQDDSFFSGGGTLTVGVVPEPSTLALLAIGTLGLLKRRRRTSR